MLRQFQEITFSPSRGEMQPSLTGTPIRSLDRFLPALFKFQRAKQTCDLRAISYGSLCTSLQAARGDFWYREALQHTVQPDPQLAHRIKCDQLTALRCCFSLHRRRYQIRRLRENSGARIEESLEAGITQGSSSSPAVARIFRTHNKTIGYRKMKFLDQLLLVHIKSADGAENSWDGAQE